jgi:cytochrome c-type biogenesis protein CcsB
MMITAAYFSLWLSFLIYVLYVRMKKDWLGKAGTITLAVSFGLLSLGLIQHSRQAGHWPLTNRYEVTLSILWAMLAIYLLLEISWRERSAAPYVLVLGLLVGSYALTRPLSEKALTPLLPVLRTIWLQVHVLTSVLGYGAFVVAAGLGLKQVTSPSLTPVARSPLNPGKGVSRGQDERQIERAMERVVALGFPWLSLGILTGAIWAQKAWGRYWGWDPKETWALITWLWYLLIMHVRSLATWRGRRLAWLVVAGFVIVAFTFIGVPWLVRTVRLESLHGF